MTPNAIIPDDNGDGDDNGDVVMMVMMVVSFQKLHLRIWEHCTHFEKKLALDLAYIFIVDIEDIPW